MDDLLRVLGNKYGIPVNNDADKMELFNRLCISVNNDQNYKALVKRSEIERNKLFEVIESLNKKIVRREEIILKLMVGNSVFNQKVRKACKKQGVSLIERDGKVGLSID